jgi:intermembrane space import and assembly protein 40
MSHCEEKGKDRVIFLTEEDAKPDTSKISLSEDPSDAPVGLITPEGDINWACPCLGGMAVGPCGQDFREAFGCFHNRFVLAYSVSRNSLANIALTFSTSDQKGSECFEKFMDMQECMKDYPDLYKEKDPMPDPREIEKAEAQSTAAAAATKSEDVAKSDS